MEKKEDPLTKEAVPFCNVCFKTLTNGKSEIQKHADSYRHQRHIAVANENQKLRDNLASLLSNAPTDSSLAEMKARILFYISEEDNAVRKVEPLVALMKALFPNDARLKNLKFKKQNAANVLRFGMPNSLLKL